MSSSSIKADIEPNRLQLNWKLHFFNFSICQKSTPTQTRAWHKLSLSLSLSLSLFSILTASLLHQCMALHCSCCVRGLLWAFILLCSLYFVPLYFSCYCYATPDIRSTLRQQMERGQELNSSVTSCDKARRGERIYQQCWTYWNVLPGGSPLWPDWNVMELRRSVLAWLEWLRKEEVGFGWTKIAGNGEVGFCLTGIVWNRGSRI
jgi:hypothetical protein